MKIEAKDLNKKYKKEQALKNLTVTFEGTKIIGLLGKNGAGKTTFMRLLAGHFQQTKGELTVNNKVPFNHYPTTKNICLIQENYNFYEKFKIDDVLKISSAFYPNWNQKEADHLLDIFKLKRKSKINTLSKGMLSAVGIIVGLASHCPITIFDEPYIGLDASFRSNFYDLLLASYQDDPRLIILSTHLIDEVSQLFEEVAILHEGELLLHETTEDLVNKHDIISGTKQEVELFLKDKNVIHKSEILGKMTAVVYNEPKEEQTNLHYSKASLQDLFVYLTKEEVAKH